MKKKIYLLMTISLLSVVMFSSLSANYDSQFTYTDAPNNYYNLSNGALEDKDLLKTELNQIISRNYKKYSYAQAWDLIAKSDEDPNNSNNVLLLYTGKSMKKSASGANGTEVWNREHVWAKSRGFSTESSPAYTDIHHLRAAEAQTNSYRSNSSFNEIDTAWCKATSSCTVDNYGNKWTSNQFEPRDEVKGDVARMLFYMEVRYQGKAVNEPTLKLVNQLTSVNPPNGSVGNGEIGMLDILIKWHYEDPVDQREVYRNNVIYSYQNNRNPFIDHPEYIDVLYPNSHTSPEIDHNKVNALIERISNIGTVTLEKKALINQIKADYDLFNTAEKNLVTNYSTLTDALNTIVELEKAEGNQGLNSILKVDFLNLTNSVASYQDNLEINYELNQFYLSSAYTKGEFRLGSNAAKTLDEKYNLYDSTKKDGSVFLIKNRLSNIKKFSLKTDKTYGTILYYGILYSQDLNSFQELKSYNAYPSNGLFEVQLDTPLSGYFGVVIIGTTPRLKFVNLEIFESENITQPYTQLIEEIEAIDLNAIQYNGSNEQFLKNLQTKYENLSSSDRLLVTNYSKLLKAFNIYYSLSTDLNEKKILTTVRYCYLDSKQEKIVLEQFENYLPVQSEIDILDDEILSQYEELGYSYVGLIHKKKFLTRERFYTINTDSNHAIYEVILSAEYQKTILFTDSSQNIHYMQTKGLNKTFTSEELKTIQNNLIIPYGFSFKEFVCQNQIFDEAFRIENDLIVQFNTEKTKMDFYTILVQNGTVDKNNVAFDTLVTVSADSLYFSYWEINRKIVSYQPVYRFTVFSNIEIKAVYNTPKEETNLFNFYEVDGSDKELIVCGVYLPSNHVLIEAGLLFDGISFENGYKFSIKKISENGEFAVIKKNFTSYKGYIIYEVNGIIQTQLFVKDTSSREIKVSFTNTLSSDATSEINQNTLLNYFNTFTNIQIVTEKVYNGASSTLKLGTSSLPGKMIIDLKNEMILSVKIEVALYNEKACYLNVNGNLQNADKSGIYLFENINQSHLELMTEKNSDIRIRIVSMTFIVENR